MAVWYFNPPTVDEGPASWESRLFIRYKLTRGISVWKASSGAWYANRYPTFDDVNQADWFYYGGKQAVVDDTNKADMIAASIGVTEANFTAAPADTPITPPPLTGENTSPPPATNT